MAAQGIDYYLLRRMLQNEPSKISVSHLRAEHFSALNLAVSNVLLTGIAEFTYAQIIDGLPTSKAWFESGGVQHIPIQKHVVVCPAALEAARNLRTSLDPGNSFLDNAAVQAYQNAAPSSKEFELRLIELTALACHEVAIYLFQHSDHSRHKEDALWVPEPMSTVLFHTNKIIQVPIPPPLPTVFCHEHYDAHEQYPNGVADMAGYWTEAAIFGGVALFDRGENQLECRDVYIHPFGPRPIFQLSQTQIDQLSEFLRSRSAHELRCPLPITTFERHTRRVEPWDAWTTENIFRSRYERELPKRRQFNCT